MQNTEKKEKERERKKKEKKKEAEKKSWKRGSDADNLKKEKRKKGINSMVNSIEKSMFFLPLQEHAELLWNLRRTVPLNSFKTFSLRESPNDYASCPDFATPVLDMSKWKL